MCKSTSPLSHIAIVYTSNVYTHLNLPEVQRIPSPHFSLNISNFSFSSFHFVIFRKTFVIFNKTIQFFYITWLKTKMKQHNNNQLQETIHSNVYEHKSQYKTFKNKGIHVPDWCKVHENVQNRKQNANEIISSNEIWWRYRMI